MRQFQLILLAMALLLPLGVSAKKKNYEPKDISGVWEVTAKSNDGGAVIEQTSGIVFREDMTFEENEYVSLTGKNNVSYKMKSHRQGTYRIVGKTILFKIDPETMTMEEDNTELPGIMRLMVTAIRESERLKLYSSQYTPLLYNEIEMYRIKSVSDDCLVLKTSGSDSEGERITTKYFKK